MLPFQNADRKCQFSDRKVFLARFRLDTGLPEVEMTHYLLVLPTVGGPGAIVPAEVGSISLGKTKIFSF